MSLLKSSEQLVPSYLHRPLPMGMKSLYFYVYDLHRFDTALNEL